VFRCPETIEATDQNGQQMTLTVVSCPTEPPVVVPPTNETGGNVTEPEQPPVTNETQPPVTNETQPPAEQDCNDNEFFNVQTQQCELSALQPPAGNATNGEGNVTIPIEGNITIPSNDTGVIPPIEINATTPPEEVGQEPPTDANTGEEPATNATEEGFQPQ